MKITTKKKANGILVDSLFTPVNGKTLIDMKYCTGKYKWTGKASDYVGNEVADLQGLHAVYVVRRTDSDGAYAQIRCITESN